MNNHYEVVGLAHPRSAWFGNVSQWASSGLIPITFSKCVSPIELVERAIYKRADAAIVELGVAGVDETLMTTLHAHGVATVVIGMEHNVGADVTVEHDDVTPAWVREMLSGVAGKHLDTSVIPLLPARDGAEASRGALIAVCGSGNTGASTIACALAQGLAALPRVTGAAPRRVLLADLARNADQGMLHDAPDVVPNIEDLVEAHQSGNAAMESPDLLTHQIDPRHYELLLGMCRPSHWVAMSAQAIESSLESLRRTYSHVVVDIDAEFEGEAECGSVDVEERNNLSRIAVKQADVVFVVGERGLKGIHCLTRAARQVVAANVEPSRIVLVVNRAGRSPLERVALTRTIGRLTEASMEAPVFLPHASVESAANDVTKLPAKLVEPVTHAAVAWLSRCGENSAAKMLTPVAVMPGSLGVVRKVAGR